jgi:voltage-gated potassium channel
VAAEDVDSGQERVGQLVLPERRVKPSRAIVTRVSIALSCVIITTVVVYLERAGYSNAAGRELTWLDALYYATVTLSTTGYGDIAPLSASARFTNVILITPLRFLFLIVLVGTTLEVLTQRSRYEWRARKWRRNVTDHTVIIGYGVKGRSAVRGLLDSGISQNRIVVVAHDEDSVREAAEQGLTCVQGDAKREAVLRQAGITRANRVIIATDQDATSVLITMLAKRLAPDATIVSAARETANAQFLRDSGADGVIVTAEAIGRLLSMSLVSQTAGQLMEDLLESGRGLELVERGITPAELGVSPDDLDATGELVLAVIRDGEVHRFDGHTVRALNSDDRIVVIRSSRSQSELGDLTP